MLQMLTLTFGVSWVHKAWWVHTYWKMWNDFQSVLPSVCLTILGQTLDPFHNFCASPAAQKKWKGGQSRVKSSRKYIQRITLNVPQARGYISTVKHTNASLFQEKKTLNQQNWTDPEETKRLCSKHFWKLDCGFGGFLSYMPQKESIMLTFICITPCLHLASHQLKLTLDQPEALTFCLWAIQRWYYQWCLWHQVWTWGRQPGDDSLQHSKHKALGRQKEGCSHMP